MKSMEPDTQPSLEGTFHAAPASDTPGKLLKAAREARGLSAQQLCEAIQLEPRYLTALEEDRFEAFDAPVFARGFLRKSASFLGLDPAVLLDGYDRLQRGPVAPTHIPPTISRIKPKRVSPWRLPLLGLAAVVALVLLVWWLVAGLGGFGSTAPAAPEEIPAEVVPAVAAPATNSPVDLAPAAPVQPAVAPDLGAGGNAAGEVPAAAAAGADLAAPAAAPVAAPAVPAAAAPARAELLVQVSNQCWVNVNGPDGRRLYVGMASPGVLRFAGAGPWQVLLGDSRQAKVSVGGRDVAVPVQQNRDNYVVRFTVTADGQIR
jgi:cytoskeleton protein RodZ